MLSDTAQFRLEQLKETYRASFAEKRRDFMACWEDVETTSWSEASQSKLMQLSHRLAGSAASYGYDALSKECAEIEALLKTLEQGSPVASDICQAISKHYSIIIAFFDEELNLADAMQGLAVTQGLQRKSIRYKESHILVIDRSTDAAGSLATLLESRGYTISACSEHEAALSTAGRIRPVIVIIDIMSGDDTASSFAMASDIEQLLGYKPGLVFTGADDDFELRMQAARQQADAFFTKPVNVHAMSSALDVLLESYVGCQGRILIVEDDDDQAGYYRSLVTGMGAVGRVVSEPSTLLEVTIDFQPELILMDIDLPNYDGFELTRMLRNHEGYFNIPVVFLTHLDDPNLHHKALQHGADDYLLKSDDENVLINSLLDRISRYRRTKNMVMFDSLTGALNRGAFIERVSEEYAALKRRGESASMAMVDVDHFKEINDTYGHVTGDVVLRRIVDFFRLRLRRSDVIGRYAGDEFIILLPGTGIEAARKLLDDIRGNLAEQEVKVDHSSVRVSLSIGVVAVDPQQSFSLDEVVAAADKRLYTAKIKGRDQVVI